MKIVKYLFFNESVMYIVIIVTIIFFILISYFIIHTNINQTLQLKKLNLTNSKLDGGLPDSLSNTGSLKVSIEENLTLGENSGNPTSDNQQLIINELTSIKNNQINGGPVQTTKIFGTDGNNQYQIKTDSTGKLLLNVQTTNNLPNDASRETKQDVIITSLTDGTQKTQISGIDDTINSGTANDPANSLAVGLRGRQTITDNTTETFLKCDSSGILEVSNTNINQ